MAEYVALVIMLAWLICLTYCVVGLYKKTEGLEEVEWYKKYPSGLMLRERVKIVLLLRNICNYLDISYCHTPENTSFVKNKTKKKGKQNG